MSIVDVLVILFVAAGAFIGWKKGLLSQLIGLVTVIVAFFVAWSFGGIFGRWFFGFVNLEQYAERLVSSDSQVVPKVVGALENILGYVILFILVLVVMRLAARFLRSLNKAPVLGLANSVGGLVVGLVKGVLISLVAIWALNLLPVPSIIDAIDGSFLAPLALKIAPGVYEQIFNPQQYEGIWEAIGKVRQSLIP